MGCDGFAFIQAEKGYTFEDPPNAAPETIKKANETNKLNFGETIRSNSLSKLDTRHLSLNIQTTTSNADVFRTCSIL